MASNTNNALDSVKNVISKHISEPDSMQEPEYLTSSQKKGSVQGVGLANPASVYCEKLGGKLVIQNTENGQVGLCHLPDGRIVEEWKLFRADHKEE